MTDCSLCSNKATKKIKDGNPKYFGKPICDDCNESRKQLFKEEGWDMKVGFWRKN